MASDTPPEMAAMGFADGSRISMALSGDNTAELTGYFEKLAQGGTVKMPLAQAPWGDSFGMVRDRFGINWMVNIAGKKS
jgi:PhnB protein